MKTEPDKKNKFPYMITITTQFELFMTKKEEDEGVDIPQELIKQEVIKRLEAGEYDIQEDSIDINQME